MRRITQYLFKHAPEFRVGHLALKLVDYVHVMSKGQVVYSAKPEELRANEEVKASYLGI